MKEEIKVRTSKDMQTYEYCLKSMGFKKTHDCMWVIIYEKNDMEVVLIREY